MKRLFMLTILVIAGLCASAQVDTTSYPKERRELRELLRRQNPNSTIDCSDFIAVGPKGDISFSNAEWLEVQKKEKLKFKGVSVVPNTEFIRIYDGSTAVLNCLLAVKLDIDGRELNIKVRRLEVYHKSAGGWCRVAGQGTEVDEKLFPVGTIQKRH